jgi:hypothetical protein
MIGHLQLAVRLEDKIAKYVCRAPYRPNWTARGRGNNHQLAFVDEGAIDGVAPTIRRTVLSLACTNGSQMRSHFFAMRQNNVKVVVVELAHYASGRVYRL